MDQDWGGSSASNVPANMGTVRASGLQGIQKQVQYLQCRATYQQS